MTVRVGFGRDLHEARTLGFEHLHRLSQTLAQARKRVGQRTNLVATADLDVRSLQLAQTDAVRQRRYSADRTDEHPPEQQVEDQSNHSQDTDERAHEGHERLLRPRESHLGGHRDDLRANRLVEFPAKAVRRSIYIDHGFGGRLYSTVTLQAGPISDRQRPGKKQRGPGGCRTHAVLLLGLPIAELVDDVGLPFDCPIARVGRIEQGFLVAVVGILLTQLVEHFGCGERRHRLRQEAVDHLRFEQRFDLLIGVRAHRQRDRHHQPRIFSHFIARVPLQQLPRDIAARGYAQEEQQYEYQIEFEEQLQVYSPLVAVARRNGRIR